MEVVLNIHVNGENKEPVKLQFEEDNANSILNLIKDEVTHLKVNGTLMPNMVLDKAVAMPKPLASNPGFFDFLKSKPVESEPVDLVKLSTMVSPDDLKKLSVEPTIDVYFKTQAGGRRRSRKTRKSRKNRKSRKSRR
jgi:hypothetical protein